MRDLSGFIPNNNLGFRNQTGASGFSDRAADKPKRVCYCEDKFGNYIGTCTDENPTITGRRCHCCTQFRS